MQQLSAQELKCLYEGEFTKYREQEGVADWRHRYLEQVEFASSADLTAWSDPRFQQRLWESDAISSIGPGQSVTVTPAYADQDLARMIFDARAAFDGLPFEERGEALQRIFDQVLAHIHPRYTPRRPQARLVRLLAAVFPKDMTCLMDAKRVWAVQRALGARRLPGGFVAQHPGIRAAIVEAVGPGQSFEEAIDRSIFSWFLWETRIDKPDEGAVLPDTTPRKASAIPSFSLLPAAAQRRSLTFVRDNVALLQAIVREAEQGISREDLVSAILAEAPQLNASSVGNIISQAMGGLGLLRLEDGAYRPTDRGHELLTAGEPAEALRGPLVGRVFGMGHLLAMLRREPDRLSLSDAARRLQSLVPTWTTTVPGSHIVAWARLARLVQANPRTGLLMLTDEGEDYAAALPEGFEERWRIDSVVGLETAPSIVADEGTIPSPSLRVAGKSYRISDIIGEGCFLSEEAVGGALALLQRRKNLVLQGPPGTGKTWLAKRLGYALIGERDQDRVVAVQFQPTLSYEDFVRGWRPDGQGGLRLADGVFLDAIAAALAEPTRPFVLVIEEINRGNPAQILGELLTLIEDSKRDPAEALRLAYPRSVNERVYVPANLYIIGTMNLADRSLALVDLALRRRFAFLNLGPELGAPWRSWCHRMGAPDPVLDRIAARVGELNDAITAHRSLGSQYKIGHSFVTPAVSPGYTVEAWARWFDEVVEHELEPLLREYWYDDESAAKEHLTRLRHGA